MAQNDFRTVIQVMYDLSKGNKELQAQLKQLENKYKIEIDAKVNSKSTEQLNDKLAITKTRADAAQKSFSAYVKTLNSSALKSNANNIKEISNAFENVKQSGDKINMSKATASVQQFKAQMKDTGAEVQSFSQILGNDIKKFAEWTLSATILMQAINSVKSAVSTVYNMDEALTDLRMVTGTSVNETQELINSYNELAQELGAVTLDVVTSGNEWLRQGRSIAETNTLIKDSMILSKVAQLDSASATQYLTSTMLGYKLATEDVLGVIDMLTSVDVEAAVSAGGIAEAMSRTSSSAELAGVSIQKLISYLATVGEVTQKEMSSVGESFKTIFARMGNVKLGQFVDEDGNDITTQINDVEKILDKVDIKLRDSATSFREFDDVLDDVGKNWNSFNEVEQNAIATTLAGVRQRENFVVLMSNYSKSLQYTETAFASSGKAMEKFSFYEESVEAKANRLKSSLDELSMNTLDSGLIKSFLDASNVMVQFVDNTDLLQYAIIALTSLGAAKLIPMIASYSSGIGALIVQEIAATGATGALAKAQSALNVVMTMNPIGAFVVAATALFAVVKGGIAIYDYFNTTLKEQQEITQELQSDYENLQTQLKSTNEELQNTSQRIDELNKKDNLTFVEQQELDNLKDTNKELQTQIDLLEKQSSYKNQELNQSIKKEFNKQYGSESNSDHWIQEAGMAWYDRSKWGGTEEGYVDYQIDRLKELNAVKADGNELTKDEAKEYEKISKYLTNVGVDYANFASRYSVDDETKQSWLDMADIINRVLDSAKYKTVQFDEIFNSNEMKSVKADLEDLAKAGQLTPEVLNTNKEFQSLLEQTGLTAQEVAEQINATVVSIDDASNSTNTVNAKLKTYKDLIDKLAPNAKMLAEAQYELSKSGKLSYDTVSDLLKAYPELENELSLTSDGYTLTKGALDNLIDSQTSEYKLAYNEAVDACNKFIDNEKLKKAGIDQTTTSIKDQMYAMLKLYEAQGQASGDTLREIQNQSTYQQMLSAWMNVGTTESNLDTAKKVVKNVEIETKTNLAEKDRKKSEDPILEAYNDEREKLDHLHDVGKKSDAVYYKELLALKDKYLKGNKKYQTEIFAIDKAYYDYQKGLADKAKKDQENLIKSKFDDLEHKYAMGDIKSEADYQKQKWELAKEYYWKNAEYLDEWKKAQEEHYKWVKESEEKSAQAKIDAMAKVNNSTIKAYNNTLSKINDEASDLTDGSTEQFNKLTEGVDLATNYILYLETEIDNLNRRYKAGKIDEENYTSLLGDLTDALDDAKSSANDFSDSLADAFKANYESVLDDLEKAYNDTTDAINDQYDAYEKLINAKKKALQADKDAADYAETLAEKTKTVTDIQSQMADLTKAANSGDREAKAQLEKLKKELADAQKDLDKTVSDHKLDLEEDALDASLDNYKTETDLQLKNNKTLYETKLADLKSLYAQEESLIRNLTQYAQSEFGAKIDELNTKTKNIIADINNGLGTSVNGISNGVTNNVKNAQTDLGSVIDSTSSSTDSQILSLLKNGKGTTGNSELNQYVKSNYGSYLNASQMVALAKLLKLTGIESTDDVAIASNRGKILNKLKSSGFKKGGTIGKSLSSGSLSELIKLSGEDVLIPARTGEGVLTEAQNSAWLKLVPELTNLSNLMTNFKIPDFSNFVTNNSSPVINLGGINITGNADSSTVSALTSAGNDIVTRLANEMRKR